MEDFNTLFNLIGPDCSDIIFNYVEQLIISECKEKLFVTKHFDVITEFKMIIRLRIHKINGQLIEQMPFYTSLMGGILLLPTMFQYMHPTFSDTIYNKIYFTKYDIHVANEYQGKYEKIQNCEYNNAEYINWLKIQICKYDDVYYLPKLRKTFFKNLVEKR